MLKDITSHFAAIGQCAAMSILCFTLGVSGCGQNTGLAETKQLNLPVADSGSYQKYLKSKLSLELPQHWRVDYDGTFIFDHQRTVIIEVSEISEVRLEITDKPEKTAKSLAYEYVTASAKNSQKAPRDFSFERVAVRGFNGVRVKWIDEFLMTLKFEVLVFELQINEHQVLVTFYFDEESKPKQEQHIVPFLNGIKL